MSATLGKRALDLAYGDVKRAFEYYLTNFSSGRPLVIAAHSQGSLHAVRLLRDFFSHDNELRRRLVVAYLIGWPVPCDGLPGIPPCNRPDQTGCFVSWNSLVWGTTSATSFDLAQSCCVNPLTWRRNSEYAPRNLNLGGVSINLEKLDATIADARCVDGKLWVHKPRKFGYIELGDNLHLMDYGLFYANIRQNVGIRVSAFEGKMQENRDAYP